VKNPVGLSTVLVGVMLASTIQLLAMGVLAADLIDELGVSRTQIGLLATANSVVGAMLAPFLGRVTDRLGPRRSAIIILLISAAGLIFTALAPTYPLLVVAAFVGGAAQGWSNPATNKLIGVHVEIHSQGVFTGIKQSGVQVAAFLAGLTLPTASLTIGWRAGLALYGVLCILLAFLTPLVVPADPPRHSVDDRPAGPGLRGPVTPLVWRITIYAFMLGVVGGTIGRFLPLFAHEALGYSTRTAGFIAALAGLAGIVARIGWGRIADRGYPARRALLIMAVLAAAASAILAISTSTAVWLAWPVAVLIGFGASAWNTVANLAIIRGVDLEDAGRSSGIMLLGFLAGISIGTPVSGLIIDATGSYTTVWLGVAVMALIGASVAAESRRPTATASVTTPSKNP